MYLFFFANHYKYSNSNAYTFKNKKFEKNIPTRKLTDRENSSDMHATEAE